MAKKQKEEWKVYKNVFDSATILNILKLNSQGHFDGLESPIALGKEANVFTALKGKQRIIVKIYRVENCNFNKMYSYIAPDPRFSGMKKRRRLVIFSWVQREYRNLLKAREAIRVPTPIAIKDNVLLMEFIGRKEPAPLLKDAPPKNPKKFFEKIIKNVKALYKAGLVHADLSKFNILNFEQEPVFIDFSQATVLKHPEAKDFLKRDIRNIVRYFEKQGLKLDEEEVYNKVVG
ncbi:serine protein kinase RIO [Candidatus Woesearchaeota archaeon]|nr:serine protein kinase RIO [Candidatus Woesearchaeota archaeon]